MKTLDTLIEDIYDVAANGVDNADDLVDKWCADLANTIKARLNPKDDNRRKKLRLSAVGRPLRYMWYELNYEGTTESLAPHQHIKFMIGDVTESLLLMLAELGGHSVTGCQDTLSIGGVEGHRDAVIDGVTVDVKSASKWGFEKFKSLDKFLADDPFHYLEQIAAYVQADTTTAEHGALLAMNKETGKLALLEVPADVMPNIEDKINAQRTAVADGQDRPDRCYSDTDDGSSGNRVLCTACSYCPYKFDCWSDANEDAGLRTFLYKRGNSSYPKYFTHVEKEPRVDEVTPNKVDKDLFDGV